MRVLYFSYNGLAEPLGVSQVLPYIRGLAERGHEYTVVSFEKPASAPCLSRTDVRALLPEGTRWRPLAYHKRPTLPATAFDVASGFLAGSLAGPVDLVHARGTVAAPMAAAVSALRGAPWVFDVRGLLAQEYVDAGHWRRGSLRDRLTRTLERRLLRRAQGIVCLTRRFAAALVPTLPSHRPHAVIPCAVDLERFAPDAGSRAEVRRQMRLADEPLMVYSGSLGSWYLPKAMLDFFVCTRSALPGLRFLVLTPQPRIAEEEVARRGLGREVLVRSVSPEEVPSHLNAADFGISFIEPAPSKIASSPTKIGEYLACGLPVVANAGVGDVEDLVGEGSGLIVGELDARAYERTAMQLRDELARPDRRERARAVAARSFGLQAAVSAYDDLYARVVGGRV